LAKRVHGLVLIDGLGQAADDERGERQGLPGFRFLVAQEGAGLGDIDLQQAMDHGLVVGGTHRRLQKTPALWIRHHLVLTVLLVHGLAPSFF
jgi:hypothetical protein